MAINIPYFPRPARLAAVALLVTLAACTPRIDVRGNLPDPDSLADLQVGKVNKEQVRRLLGSPSSIAPLQGESWYYVSERTETLAFLAPEIIERTVLIVRFDDKGTLKEIKKLGLEAGRDIQLVDRETPTAGKEVTFLQQLFGNLGRFEADEN